MSFNKASRSKSADIERYDGLQVLRGFAALMVLYCHCTDTVVAMPSAQIKALAPFIYPGAAGVDLFFIISGFVIAMILHRKRSTITARGFVFDRASRILPMYFLASIPCLFIGKLSSSTIWNTFTFIPFVDNGSTYSGMANQFCWTIGMEVWFYSVMATCLLICRSNLKASLWIFSITLLSLVGWSLSTPDAPLYMRFIGSPMVLEFLFGIILFILHRSLTPVVSAALLLSGIFSFCMISSDHYLLGRHFYVIQEPEFALQRAILWGLPCMAITAGVIGLSAHINWSRWAMRLGDISYSFYLVQVFLLLAIPVLHLNNLVLGFVLLLALNFVVATVVWRWIELPCTAWLRLRFSPKFAPQKVSL